MSGESGFWSTSEIRVVLILLPRWRTPPTSTLPVTIDNGKIVWQDKFAPARNSLGWGLLPHRGGKRYLLPVFSSRKVSAMTRRLIPGTANERGRRIFVQPADGTMKLVSYGRIRLDKDQPEIRFSNDGQETGLI